MCPWGHFFFKPHLILIHIVHANVFFNEVSIRIFCLFLIFLIGEFFVYLFLSSVLKVSLKVFSLGLYHFLLPSYQFLPGTPLRL